MVFRAVMNKVPEFPRPHHFDVNWDMGMESAVANHTTIIPIINYDEGLGAISAYESNPQNAAFAEYAGSNCFPTSKIESIFAQLTVSMTKGAIETDKIQAINFATGLVHSSFNESGLAADEISTLDLNEILELQVEATDRQMGPLYNAIDMKDGKLNSGLDMGPDQAFLDTDLELEGIAFQENKYFDCLHYYTNGAKLRSVFTGLQFHQVNRHNTVKKLRFKQQSNTKYMNPYAFLGLMVYCPQSTNYTQIGKATETTDIGHVNCSFEMRYNEHNHEFNHALI